MVGEACLPSNAYYPRTPDYTLCSGVHVCWSEHSDSSFVYGFMIMDYGFGTMTATTSCTILFRLFTDVSQTQFPRTMLVLGPGSTHLVTTANLWPRYDHIESYVAVH